MDIDQGDIRHLSFADNFADAIAAIHVIEHFYAWEVPPMLSEWLRVLKPGGRLILELPCMDKVFNHVFHCMKKNRAVSMAMTWFALWGDPGYQDTLMTHKYGYTQEQLKATVQRAGFINAEFVEPNYHFPMRDMRIEAIKPC